MPKFKKILVLHGPNLNLLGEREPQHYGADTLNDINGRLARRAMQAGAELDAFQSNAEHELVERIQAARTQAVEFIIINPAALNHTSFEVHLSNVYGRESFRRHSYFSDLAAGVISGLGAIGYELALEHALSEV